MANPREDGQQPGEEPSSSGKFQLDPAPNVTLYTKDLFPLKINPADQLIPKIVTKLDTVRPKDIPTRILNSYKMPTGEEILFDDVTGKINVIEPLGDKKILGSGIFSEGGIIFKKTKQKPGVLKDTQIPTMLPSKRDPLPSASTLLETIAGNPSAASVVRKVTEDRIINKKTPPKSQ